MRRILLFTLFALLIAVNSVMVCFANQIETDLGVSVQEDTMIQEEQLQEEQLQEENTFSSRLGEFWEEHRSEIISILSDAASLGLIVFALIKKFKGSNKKLDLSAAQSTAVYNSQKKLDASNKLVENAVERINQAQNKFESAESSIKKYFDMSKNGFEQLVKLCTNTQEMLVSISSRSKEIPSQVKDMMDAKYVESLKLASCFSFPEEAETENKSE